MAVPILSALILLATLSGCLSSAPPKVVDLTYPFGEETVYWPTNEPFRWEKTHWGTTSAGYWYTAGKFSTSEHGGTHMDAPIHFGEGRHALDEIPAAQLIGPAVVLDLRAQSRANPDYEATVEDVLAWETRHGRIEPGTIVFLLTGWGERWPDRGRYLGSPTPHDPATLHFPGLSRDAAAFLVSQRAVKGVGIDTASIDPGRSRDFPVHRVLNGANVYALENVAALEDLPARGATVYALPMKIRGGTGGPVRIIGVVPAP